MIIYVVALDDFFKIRNCAISSRSKGLVEYIFLNLTPRQGYHSITNPPPVATLIVKIHIDKEAQSTVAVVTSKINAHINKDKINGYTIIPFNLYPFF
jgi:hypothetical protein